MAIQGFLRNVLWEVLSILVVGAIGLAVVHLVHLQDFWREILAASTVSLLAAILAHWIMQLLRRFNGADAAQAGLAGLTVLLLGTVALAAVASPLLRIEHSVAFVWWLLVFSWTSLVLVSISAIAMVRAASVNPRGRGDDR